MNNNIIIQELLAPAEIVEDEIVISAVLQPPSLPVTAIKSFGIIDIWRIHTGKREANVYPRRV